MPLDSYDPCPAGTGKKLKFCCSDLITELNLIQRMLEGDQRLACLEHIEKLQEKFPNRPCLLTTQALLLLGMNRIAEAKQTVEKVLAAAPVNPVALAESAVIALGEGRTTEAIDALQQALSLSPSPLPGTVVDVLSSVPQALLATGQIAAARGHLLLLASLMPKNEEIVSLLFRLNASPSVPLLFKEDPDLRAAPESASWKQAFTEAMQPAGRGNWRLAAEKLAALAATVADSPEIWHNLAQLRLWLANSTGAVDALRRLARLSPSPDEQVEAEALAQLIDPASHDDRISSVSITFPIANEQELTEKFAGDRRIAPTHFDPAPWSEMNEPPPRQAYVLLDRPMPRSGIGLARAEVPSVIAHLLLFGRQTDREGRLEVDCDGPQLATVRASLQEIAATALGPAGPEETNPGIPASQAALSWNWRLPDDTPIDAAQQLLSQQRSYAVQKQWTATPLAVLRGKTPQQAAADPALHVALSAAILLLELGYQEASAPQVFAEVRSSLGLPLETPIDPATVAVDHLPLARLHRLEIKKLDDDTLLALHRRALFNRAQIALRDISLDILSRESMKHVGFAQIYGLLAQMEEGDTSRALVYLDKAREAAEAAGESTANWDLQELSLRLERGEPEEFARVLSHIQSQHAREPGVAAALTQILVSAGLITPDGRPRQPVGPQADLAPIAPPDQAGKIWTPQDETPGKKSALWIPD